MAWFERLMEQNMNEISRRTGNTYGGSVGNLVWDGTKWIQRGNMGDPEQVLQNRPEQSELAESYLNWDSAFNQNMRSWLERMFAQSAGGADSLYAAGLDPASGVGTMQGRIARARAANDAGSAAWQQFMGGQQMGVQAQLAHEQGTQQLRSDLNQRQMFNDQRRDALTGDILGGIVDLGLTAATGGFGSLFGGGEAEGALSPETQAELDASLNTPLATPAYTPQGSSFRRDAVGSLGPTMTPAPRASQKVTWNGALNMPAFSRQPFQRGSGDYASSLTKWQGPYAGVPALNNNSGLTSAWWNVNNWWKGY